LKKLEKEEINYGLGWSRGKERFRGVIDTGKGSFYANPIRETMNFIMKNKPV